MKKEDYIVAYFIAKWGSSSIYREPLDEILNKMNVSLEELSSAAKQFKVLLGFDKKAIELDSITFQVGREMKDKTITQARAIVRDYLDSL